MVSAAEADSASHIFPAFPESVHRTRRLPVTVRAFCGHFGGGLMPQEQFPAEGGLSYSSGETSSRHALRSLPEALKVT